jgi:hypothetical protein
MADSKGDAPGAEVLESLFGGYGRGIGWTIG